MLTSIVIRTLNEQEHLPELLQGIARQDRSASEIETIIVDSGSTDDTLEIARAHGCRIAHIAREDFSFGRSLNIGCALAEGEHLVFVSGHCLPVDDLWIGNLLRPLAAGQAAYVYGRQLGRRTTKFSERRVFRRYFPAESRLPQTGFFCNNANAAIGRATWEAYRFDESLTGLEDLDLAKRLAADGHGIGYVAEAAVYHIHNESWPRVVHRYQREAIALQSIMPEIHVGFADFLRYTVAGIVGDLRAARGNGEALALAREIALFRLCQYWGTYRGNREHRKLSRQARERLFYPS